MNPLLIGLGFFTAAGLVIGWVVWAERGSRLCSCGHTRDQHVTDLSLMSAHTPCKLCLPCDTFVPRRRWGR